MTEKTTGKMEIFNGWAACIECNLTTSISISRNGSYFQNNPEVYTVRCPQCGKTIAKLTFELITEG